MLQHQRKKALGIQVPAGLVLRLLRSWRGCLAHYSVGTCFDETVCNPSRRVGQKVILDEECGYGDILSSFGAGLSCTVILSSDIRPARGVLRGEILQEG